MLTVEEAASRLGVSARQVRNLIAGGGLKATKKGWAWLISEQAVVKAARTPRKPGPKPGNLTR